jgi:hypothetical protein
MILTTCTNGRLNLSTARKVCSIQNAEGMSIAAKRLFEGAIQSIFVGY